MPVTSDGRWSPADSDDWDLTTDLAAMQVSNQTATASAIAAIRIPFQTGTNAQRLALSGANLYAGLTFRTSDNGGFEWYNTNGTSAGWRVSGGQILASINGPTGNTGGSTAGTLVGSVASTIVLPVGQRFIVQATCSPYSNAASLPAEVACQWRNNAADVTFATYNARQVGRGYSAGGNLVLTSASFTMAGTTTVAAKVSAALYTVTAISQVYGADGTQLMIVSA